MKQQSIKCKCGKIIIDNIYLLLPVSCRYLPKTGFIATQYIHIPLRYQHPKHAVAFECPDCGKEFPRKMNKKILKYLLARRIFHALKKD